MWVWYARLPIHPTTCQLLYFPQNICVFLCLYLRCVSVCHMPDIHQPASDFSLWNFRLNLSVYLQQQLLQYLLKWNFVSKILQCHGQSVNLPLDFQKPLFFLICVCTYLFVHDFCIIIYMWYLNPTIFTMLEFLWELVFAFVFDFLFEFLFMFVFSYNFRYKMSLDSSNQWKCDQTILAKYCK